MSDETAAEPPTAQEAKPEPARRSIWRAVGDSDPFSLGALVTAIVAGGVGVVQTGFMWEARNDQVEAALRAQQLRACVAYRGAAYDANESAQLLAQDDNVTKQKRTEFRATMRTYQNAVTELGYVLPSRNGPALDAVEQDTAEVIATFDDDDQDRLAELARSTSPWATHHAAVIDACDSVIRDIRDR